MGPYDYYVYSNSLVTKSRNSTDSHQDDRAALGFDRRYRRSQGCHQIQYNIVRVDGQRSVYLPIMKQGGDTNTIQVVNGIRDMIGSCSISRSNLKPTVVFDQSAFVKEAIKTLLQEGMIGLALTSLMILIFLASLRATWRCFCRFRFPRWPHSWFCT